MTEIPIDKSRTLLYREEYTEDGKVKIRTIRRCSVCFEVVSKTDFVETRTITRGTNREQVCQCCQATCFKIVSALDAHLAQKALMSLRAVRGI